MSPGLPAARALGLAGAALLVLSAFLPQDSTARGFLPGEVRSAGSLWSEGIGWPLVAAAFLLGFATLRGRGGAWSWVGLWVGLLAGLNALVLLADDAFRPVGPGLILLTVAAVTILAGWGIGYAVVRPAVAGLTTAGAPPEREARSPVRSLALWVPLAYGALSLLLWGLPVLGDFGSTLIAQNSIDPSIYTWFYAWWPHAVGDGLNPFVTEAIFAPDGYNLTWVTSVPGPSLLMSPVTAALGPVVTYNVLALVAPALAAWTAFLLCRHLTGALAPSLLAGYVFGFSPYMLGMLQGSPHLYFVALVPLFVLLVLRRLEGSIGERAFFVAMTAGVAAQFLTSHDVLATMTVFGALALAAGFALFPQRRAILLRTAAVLAGAYLAAAVLVSPFVFHMLFREHTTPEQNTPFFANDLLSWVLPDSSLLVATSHEPGGTNPYFGGLAYFGIPLLLLVGLYAWQNRHTATGRLLALCFAAPAVAGLGQRLTVAGDITRIGLPWAALDHLPGLKLLVPQRFPLYAFLAAAVMAALWLRSRPGAARWALAALVVVSMLPWVRSGYWKTPLATPEFITSGDYRRYLGPEDRVVAIPTIGDSMRWQAEEDFPFELAGGGVGAFPESYARYPVFGALVAGGPLPPSYARDLRRFLADKGATALVVDKNYLDPSRRRLLASLGADPLDTGGVLLYRLGERSGLSRQRTSVASTLRPSREDSFLPSSKLRAR